MSGRPPKLRENIASLHTELLLDLGRPYPRLESPHDRRGGRRSMEEFLQQQRVMEPDHRDTGPASQVARSACSRSLSWAVGRGGVKVGQ
jgi:hypothetical protein